MRADELTVEVRDRDLNRVGIILTRDLDLTAKVVWSGVGEWTLTLPENHPLVPALKTPGSGIIVTGPVDGGTGVVFSGPRLPAVRVRDQQNPDGTLTFKGVTDEIVLDDALAYPSPGVVDPNAQTAANDERTGTTEALMRQYVAYNIGPLAPAGRRRGFRSKVVLAGSDMGRGVTTARSPRFQNLLELLQSLATEGTLGFRVVQVGSQLQFQVVPVRDLRATVRLDLNNGTILSEESQDQGPTLTYAIVAGQGEGVDRTMVVRTRSSQATEEAQWGRPIERFYDRRDTDNLLELQAKGDEELSLTGEGVAIKLMPSDDQTMRYLVDWNVGDWVTAVVNGQETWSVVTEAVVRATSKFSGVGMSIGDVTSFTPESRAQAQANKNDSRIGYLERSLQEMPVPEPGTPVGAVVEWYASSIPDGWARLEGQAISRTDHAELFTLIGTTFGAGNGTTTFNLPDRRGRVAAGVSTSDPEFDTLGKLYGSKTHTLTQDEMPKHRHTPGLAGHNFQTAGTGAARQYAGTGGNRWFVTSTNVNDINVTSYTNEVGDDEPHNNIQPTISAHFIMRVK